MYNDLKNIHIGKLIETKLKASGMSYACFARELNIDRTTVYSILKSKSIDIERLIRISKILNHDFLRLVYLNDNETNNLPSIIIDSEQLDEILKSGGLTLQLKKDKQ